MQKTITPQTTCKVPPSKEGKWKKKITLSYQNGKKGGKEGGREAHSLDEFQTACWRAQRLWRSQVQLKFPAEMNTQFWLLSDHGIKISDYFAYYGHSLLYQFILIFKAFFRGTWNLKKQSSLYQLPLLFFFSHLASIFLCFYSGPSTTCLSFFKKNFIKQRPLLVSGLDFQRFLTLTSLNDAKWNLQILTSL